MSLGSQAPVQAAYTAAGAQALAKGCLIVAAAGNDSGQPTGAPANSPTIFAVAAPDRNLVRNLVPPDIGYQGKIQIAAPGRDLFSSAPRPTRYRTMSGTSMATPHVAGCGRGEPETMTKPGTWIVTGACSLAELGMVVVQGSAAQARAWRRLPGVAAVEAAAAVDIGPPGTDPT